MKLNELLIRRIYTMMSVVFMSSPARTGDLHLEVRVPFSFTKAKESDCLLQPLWRERLLICDSIIPLISAMSGMDRRSSIN